jgi:hypothetical protein
MAATYICLIAGVKLGVPMTIRRIIQLDQIDEMVKSTAERGRPILITPGGLTATDSYTPAWGTIFAHVGEMAGNLNLRIVSTYYLPAITIVMQDYIRDGYTRAGHPERFRPDDHMCILGSTFTWTQGTIGVAQRLQPGAAFIMGSWDWASHVNVMKALTLNPIKPIMMGGAGWVDLVAFCSVFCDYVMIGDQHMAAQAVLSEDPWHPAQLIGVDIIKLMFVAILILAFITAALNIPFLEYF